MDLFYTHLKHILSNLHTFENKKWQTVVFSSILNVISAVGSEFDCFDFACVTSGETVSNFVGVFTAKSTLLCLFAHFAISRAISFAVF